MRHVEAGAGSRKRDVSGKDTPNNDMQDGPEQMGKVAAIREG